MKRLAKTSQIEALLRAGFGAEADTSQLAVFEFVAANLNALRKSGGIYQGARFTQNTLAELAGMVAKESIQLITNHDGSQMPVGRVFAGEVKGEALHVLVALNETTEPKLVADIEAGIIDQVSVSVNPARLLCSECNFDFVGDEATMDNWWDLTCNEGHTIGVNGVHVRIAGASSWSELSLVGMGAVPGARSVPREQSAFAESGIMHRLAASGLSHDRLLCSNHVHQPKAKDSNPMDLAQFTAELTASTTARVNAEVQLTQRTAERDTAVASLTAANERITALEAAAATAPKAEDFTAVMAAMSDITKKALVALGDKDAVVPTDPAKLIEAMTDAQAKLSAVIPTGPVSVASDTDKSAKSANTSMRAFASK